MIYQTLQNEFCKWTGYKHAVALNSGTSALHLALLAMGVGQGDEVIVPDFTFASCAFAVSYCGATPIFVDCDDTLNIDVDLIEEKITDKTKVIMAVHVYGRRCDMESIKRIADKYNLLVLEDLSEGHGIQPTGDISIYSFQSSKIIHAQEGGILITNNDKWAEEINLRKTLANRGDYFHPFIGFNYRMPDEQAKLALESLRNIERNLEMRKSLEEFMKIKFPCNRPRRDVAWVYDYVCNSIEERDKMLIENIGTRCFFKPLSSLPMYNKPVGKNAQLYSELGIVFPIKI